MLCKFVNEKYRVNNNNNNNDNNNNNRMDAEETARKNAGETAEGQKINF